jgi:hypothetical protein
MLEVTPNLAPFAYDHPHARKYGHYAVAAVNLCPGSTAPEAARQLNLALPS